MGGDVISNLMHLSPYTVAVRDRSALVLTREFPGFTTVSTTGTLRSFSAQGSEATMCTPGT